MPREPHDRAQRTGLALAQAGSSPSNAALVVISVEQLRSIVREELASLLETDHRQSEWLTTDDVAQMLGYRRLYVSELVRRHGLPSHQPSGPRGRHMFRRSEVDAWAVRRPGRR